MLVLPVPAPAWRASWSPARKTSASAVAQVQPLLPPGHHGILVTSRNSLTGLGRLRTVNRLRPEDAVVLLDTALKNMEAVVYAMREKILEIG